MSEAFEATLRAMLAPDPDGDIVDWLERNVKSVPYSPNPGPFRVESTPYLAPILRSLQDPEVETVVVMGNVQSGKSMVLELWSAFIPARTPGPTLLLQDVDLNAQDWQQTRLKPLWEATPATAAMMDTSDRSKWHSTHFKRNNCWVLGADNERNLQRRSIRFLGMDECWQYEQGRITQALARRTAFKWQGKTVLVSQGGVDDPPDEFTALFNSTDRREWMFRCPHCGEQQAYEWGQIKYPEDARTGTGWDLDKVRSGTTYECRGCKHRFLDRNTVRQELNATASFVPMNPSAPKGRVGFHFNALAMQWGLSWGDLAVECIEAAIASEDSDDTKKRDFKQKRLALPWTDEPDDTSAEVLPSGYRMEQEWEQEAMVVGGKITPPPFTPEQISTNPRRLRFMSVDVQRKGLYFAVRAWSADGKSRLVRWRYVDQKNDTDVEREAAWQEVRQEQLRLKVDSMFVFVDSGDGMNLDEVYRHCAEWGWNATKGDQATEYPHRIHTPYGVKVVNRPYKPAKVIQVGQRSCRLYLFSNLMVKDTLARLRRKGDHTYPEDAGTEYRAQMQSEHRTRTESGKPIWAPIGDRANHLWDCEVIGLVPALMAKIVGRGKNRKGAEEGVDKDEAPAKV